MNPDVLRAIGSPGEDRSRRPNGRFSSVVFGAWSKTKTWASSAVVCWKKLGRLAKIVIVATLLGLGYLLFLMQGAGHVRSGGVQKELVAATSRASDDFLFWKSSAYKNSLRKGECSRYKKCTIQLVADLDHSSLVKEATVPTFKSHILSGLIWTENEKVMVTWKSEFETVYSPYNEGGRGMELSELVLYQSKLLAFDDRTGIVFHLIWRGTPPEPHAVPMYVISEGDGFNSEKGQKIEWATEKDGDLWIGSFGKEFTKDGVVRNTNNMWVAVIDSEGRLHRKDWKPVYNRLRKAVGAEFPGYLLHEAVRWSPHLRKWVFLPRRFSKEMYDEKKDNVMGTNLLILADEDFSQVEIRRVAPDVLIDPVRGYSTFQFLPGSKDEIVVAVKSAENVTTGEQTSYVSVFTISGKLMIPETEIPGHVKFEGVEIYDRQKISLQPQLHTLPKD